MSSRLLAVTIDVRDPERAGTFWARLLGRELVEEPGGVRLPGDERQVGLRFVGVAEPSTSERGLHLHVTSSSAEDQTAMVERALRYGAQHLDVGQRPEEGHVVLADPEGNPLCVIEPDNGFLAGCGPLGEVACDGTHAVGEFWHRVLDWPLVWDHDEETAIQSPAGGTKVAWGGPPLAPKDGRNPQRFDLVSPDPESEGSRLTGWGATRLESGEMYVEYADPDGNEFRVYREQ